MVCREVTKPHAEWTRGTLPQVAEDLLGAGAHKHALRGEFTLVVGPSPASDA